MNGRITRCAPIRAILTHLRSVVQVALAAMLLLIASTGFTLTPAHAQTAARAATLTRMRLTAWRYALRQRGKPYLWAGTGPAGFDCSGLVYAAYRAAGIRLPRTTYAMLDSRLLVRIPKAQARSGDLAFFGTGHVEMYRWGRWTYGAADSGTRIGFHLMNPWWHPTMYFRVR